MKIPKYIMILGIILLILIANEGLRTVKYITENNRLHKASLQYQNLTTEINEYETIKNNLLSLNDQSESIQSKITATNNQIDSLTQEIADYQNKIAILSNELSK